MFPNFVTINYLKMKTTTVLILGTYLLMSLNSKAQNTFSINDIKDPNHKSPLIKKSNYNYNNIKPLKDISCMLLSNNDSSKPIVTMPSGIIYTAFFCKTEVNLRNRFNVWIKMRVGNFDSYDQINKDVMIKQ